MNNFRLTTNKFNKVDYNILHDKMSNLFSKSPVYEIRNGIRFLKNLYFSVWIVKNTGCR